MADGDTVLVATAVRYLSAGDETCFFEWLKRISCVADVRGEGLDLLISLRTPPRDDDLRELIALFFRYDVDMRQLARFATPAWATDPSAYWHKRVFATQPS
jgi:hypothetical protein